MKENYVTRPEHSDMRKDLAEFRKEHHEDLKEIRACMNKILSDLGECKAIARGVTP